MDTMIAGIFVTFTCSIVMIFNVLLLAAPSSYSATNTNTDDPMVLQLIAKARRLGPVGQRSKRHDVKKNILLSQGKEVKINIGTKAIIYVNL
jgi:hypothetical protein